MRTRLSIVGQLAARSLGMTVLFIVVLGIGLRMLLPGAPPARLALAWGFIAAGALVVHGVQMRLVHLAEQHVRSSEELALESDRRLEASLRELESHAVGTLQALVSAVDAKDSYTASHSVGVADCACAIGRRIGLGDEQLLLLEKAALLHDVGKIGISERILLKPDALDSAERGAIEEHALLGAQIVESIPFLADVVPVIRHHHERWDGTGYPDALAGEDIPLLARILGVADSYDAMSSDRPYRSALVWFRVRQQLRRNSGTQFDPRMVSALIEALRAGEVAAEPRRVEVHERVAGLV